MVSVNTTSTTTSMVVAATTYHIHYCYDSYETSNIATRRLIQQHPARHCRPFDIIRRQLASTMARTLTYHDPYTKKPWEMKFAEGHWWARWVTSARALPRCWTPVIASYLDQPWYWHDQEWQVLDEAQEVRNLSETQIAFYRLTFDVIPCWERMLAEHLCEEHTRSDQTDTYEFENVGHLILHHAIHRLCNLRRRSGEECFRYLEEHVLYYAGEPAETHWRAIASLGNIFPNEGQHACASATTVCYTYDQWFNDISIHSSYTSFDDYHRLDDMLDARAHVQKLRAKVRRCALLGTLKIALQSSELVQRHWPLLVTISNFAH